MPFSRSQHYWWPEVDFPGCSTFVNWLIGWNFIVIIFILVQPFFTIFICLGFVFGLVWLVLGGGLSHRLVVFGVSFQDWVVARGSFMFFFAVFGFSFQDWVVVRGSFMFFFESFFCLRRNCSLWYYPRTRCWSSWVHRGVLKRAWSCFIITGSFSLRGWGRLGMGYSCTLDCWWLVAILLVIRSHLRRW